MPLTFLVPAFLLAFAALAVPLVLHLRHRERQRPQRFPSLMFLERLAIHTAERRRITDWPLLLLRALVVALAVLAFARPVLRARGPADPAGAARTVVIALDRSLSMGHRTTWPAALDSVRRIVGQLGADDRVALVAFDDDASIIQPLTADHAAVVSAAAAIRTSTKGTRNSSALRAARQLLDADGITRAEVLVVTDLQRSGAGGVAGMSLRPGMTVRAVAVTPPPANTALTGLTAERRPGQGRGGVVISAQVISRRLDAPRDVRLTLVVNGRPSGDRNLRIPKDGVTPVRFDEMPLPPGDVRVTLAMTPDALPTDDAANAVIPAEVSHRIMLIAPRDAVGTETLFLERALSIGNSPAFEIVRRSAVDPAVLRDAGAVLLYDTPLPVGTTFDAWVRAGGGVIVAAGRRMTTPTTEPGILPGTFRGRVERVADRGGALGDVSLDHPIFEPFRAGGSAALSEPRFLRYPRITMAAGADVLARFDDGNPALLERRVDDGRVLLLAMPLDARSGDFPLHPAYLPFLRQVILHAMGFVPIPLARTTGEGWRPTLTVTDLVIRTPADDLVRPDSGTTVGAVRLEDAGFYRAYRERASGEPVAVVAVNPPARESDLSAMPASELLLGVGQDADTALTTGRVSIIETEGRQQLWRVLLIATGLFLVAEVVVASRGWRGIAGRFAAGTPEGSAP